MMEIWCAKVAVIQIVEFQHVASLGVKQVSKHNMFLTRVKRHLFYKKKSQNFNFIKEILDGLFQALQKKF